MKAWFIPVLILAFYLVGPKPSKDITVKEPELPEEGLAQFIDAREKLTDALPQCRAKVEYQKEASLSEFVVVYFHGYSACRQETSPLTKIIADSLEANTYHLRLTAHGFANNDVMTRGNAQEWINDALEALRIAQKLGRRIVFIGVSTGASLAQYIAHKYPGKVEFLIAISPNFGPKNLASEILTMPWGIQIANLIQGPRYSWKPENPDQAKYWSHNYPTIALAEMMNLVEITRNAEYTNLPKVFYIYHEKDQVVSPTKIKKMYQKINSCRKQILSWNLPTEKSHHVLAGNILSPKSTKPMADAILTFIRKNQTIQFQGENCGSK